MKSGKRIKKGIIEYNGYKEKFKAYVYNKYTVIRIYRNHPFKSLIYLLAFDQLLEQVDKTGDWLLYVTAVNEFVTDSLAKKKYGNYI